MMRLLLALAALAAATAAHSAVLQATPATLQAVLAKALPGDTLTLSAGGYGDVAMRKVASPAIQITSAAPANPATFRSLNINASAGLHLDHVAVAFTPDAKTVAWTPAVIIQNSHDVALTASKVIGGPAVNGVAATATVLDATGNVIGLPAGYGVDVVSSQDVTIADDEIALFHHLVVYQHVSRLTIQHNDLHDRRTTGITGGDGSYVTIDGNTIRAATPWMPTGVFGGAYDHADCVALYSAAGQITPNDHVRVINNRMEQLSGAPILGMWFQGGVTGASPFINFEISGNTLLIPNWQGILLVNSRDGVVERNTLIQAAVAGVSPIQRPTILLRANVTNVSLRNNGVSSAISDQSGGQNPQAGNRVMTGQVAAGV